MFLEEAFDIVLREDALCLNGDTETEQVVKKLQYFGKESGYLDDMMRPNLE